MARWRKISDRALRLLERRQAQAVEVPSSRHARPRTQRDRHAVRVSGDLTKTGTLLFRRRSGHQAATAALIVESP
jgi:hypothetical protein